MPQDFQGAVRLTAEQTLLKDVKPPRLDVTSAEPPQGPVNTPMELGESKCDFEEINQCAQVTGGPNIVSGCGHGTQWGERDPSYNKLKKKKMGEDEPVLGEEGVPLPAIGI